MRRDYNELFKGMESDKEITKDDLKRYLDNVQAATDKAIKQLEEVAGEKETEVLEV